MIRHFFVRGYKSLDLSLELGTITVVTGENSSGKSNLLKAMEVFRNIVGGAPLSKALGESPLFAFDLSDGGINGLIAKELAQMTFEVEVDLENQTIARLNAHDLPKNLRQRFAKRIRYQIEIGFVPRTGQSSVLSERLQTISTESEEENAVLVETVGGKIRLYAEGARGYREALTGEDRAQIAMTGVPSLYPHVFAFREEVSRWRFYALEPRELRRRCALKHTEALAQSGENLAAFLSSLRHTSPAQFDNVQRVLRCFVPGISGISVNVDKEGQVYFCVRENGNEFSSDVVSDGVLRILGILAALSPTSQSTLVALDMPEIGIYPRRLGLLAEVIRNAAHHCQVLVTTHSPLLTEHLVGDRAVNLSLDRSRLRERGVSF